MKTYLDPLMLRRGQPVLIAAKKDGEDYRIIIYHDIQDVPDGRKCYRGTGDEYASVRETRISKVFYNAMIAEAKRNKGRVEQSEEYKKRYFRKCRKCKSSVRKGEPCQICSLIKTKSVTLWESGRLTIK